MKINKDIIARDIQGDTVLLNMKTGDYFSLNTVGTDIYNCLEKDMDEESIIAFLAENYVTELSELKQDVQSLISNLVSNQILIT